MPSINEKETCPAFCAWCGRKDICGGRNRAVEVYGDDDD